MDVVLLYVSSAGTTTSIDVWPVNPGQEQGILAPQISLAKCYGGQSVSVRRVKPSSPVIIHWALV